MTVTAVTVTAAIETLDLCKTFAPLLPRFTRRQPTIALDGVTLSVPQGSIMGLLGPNGAGKTTFIKLLCGLVLPTRGTARVAGHDLVREAAGLHRRIGLVTSDERSFYWRLTGRQNLEFFATLYNLKGRALRARVDELLTLVDLTADADRRFDAYSSGMKQRLAVARGLLHDPDILFLDEPTKGLDPQATLRVHALVQDLVRRGKTVVIATQRLDEAEKLCQRIAFFSRGKVKAEGTQADLRARFAQVEQYSLSVTGLGPAALAQVTSTFPAADVVRDGDGHRITLKVSPSGDDLARAIHLIVASGGAVREVNHARLELEDLFARIMQG
jgi:ABC-2 type transport system ATP-binding protein